LLALDQDDRLALGGVQRDIGVRPGEAGVIQPVEVRHG
jgi:hypothetical protein